MKKIIGLVLLVAMLAMGFSTVGSAATKYETKIEYGVNFRAEPSVSATIYTMLKTGSYVHVIEKVNTYWLKVQTTSGKVGYISSNPKYTDYKYVPPVVVPVPTKTDLIIDLAKSLQGKVTYQYGKRDVANLIFDCSSFTEYVFASQGIDLKWGTRYQKDAGAYVDRGDLQKGDLIFFTIGSSTSIGHVGIYIGEGTMIHNNPSGNGVNISTIESGYWNSHYVTARRVL